MTSQPIYEIWRPGNGRTSRPEAWQQVSQLQALDEMRRAFAKNFRGYVDRHPEVPIDAAAIWWRYLHEFSGCIDLGPIRVRRREPP